MEILIVVVIAAYAYIFGSLGKSGERRRADLAESKARRYKAATQDVETWCGHMSPEARLIAQHIRAHGEGYELNSGTPHGDEPCTVSGLRDQLQRIGA